MAYYVRTEIGEPIVITGNHTFQVGDGQPTEPITVGDALIPEAVNGLSGGGIFPDLWGLEYYSETMDRVFSPYKRPGECQFAVWIHLEALQSTLPDMLIDYFPKDFEPPTETAGPFTMKSRPAIYSLSRKCKVLRDGTEHDEFCPYFDIAFSEFIPVWNRYWHEFGTPPDDRMGVYDDFDNPVVVNQAVCFPKYRMYQKPLHQYRDGFYVKPGEMVADDDEVFVTSAELFGGTANSGLTLYSPDLIDPVANGEILSQSRHIGFYLAVGGYDPYYIRPSLIPPYVVHYATGYGSESGYIGYPTDCTQVYEWTITIIPIANVWSDTEGGNPETPGTNDAAFVSIARWLDGKAIRGKISGTHVLTDWRSSDRNDWLPTPGEKTGAHPAVYWKNGFPHCVYSSSGLIKDWSIHQGTEENIVSGTYPCVAINQGGNLIAFAYRSGTGYKCQVRSSTGGELTEESTIPAVNAQNAPGTLLWRSDGVLEFSHSDGTNITTYLSRDRGKTWTAV